MEHLSLSRLHLSKASAAFAAQVRQPFAATSRHLMRSGAVASATAGARLPDILVHEVISGPRAEKTEPVQLTFRISDTVCSVPETFYPDDAAVAGELRRLLLDACQLIHCR